MTTEAARALDAALSDARRLHAAASAVPEGAAAADVGTDHARIPIAWARSGWCHDVWALDVAAAPLEVAAQNVRAAGLDERITLLRSDGLDALPAAACDAVTICGMGGRSIAAIVARAPRPGDGRLSRIVVQPNKRIEAARSALLERGWRLMHERLVEESGRLYAVLVADAHQGLAASDLDDAERFVGPHLPSSPLWPAWQARELAWREPRARALARAGSDEAAEAARQVGWLRAAVPL